MKKKTNSQDQKKDEQVEEMLHKALGRYQEILFKAANSKKDEDVNSYKKRFFKEMDSSGRKTAKECSDVVLHSIPFRDMSISELLRSYGANYSGEDILLTTYSKTFDVVVKSIAQYKDRLNQKIIERQSKSDKPITVMELRDIVNKDLAEDKVSIVQYANGASVPVDKYASMLARSTRAETENLSMIQQALREGIDLVECDIVSPTCDTCAVYQGRVYSISGNDSRYPALYKTAFKSGYSIIHPNCRHSWSPYRAELYTDEERAQAFARSNRSWKPDGDGRIFQQTERAREQYAVGQQKMRQWNAEILEFERMKTYYKGIGEEPPYKTLGAFRREARKPVEKQAPAMKSWKRHYGDQQQYERWKGVVGTENMPKTLAKFQQIKYNRNTQEKYARLEKTFQGYSAYKRDNPDATPSDYRTALKLKEQGTQGTIQIPAQIIDTNDYTFRDWHVNEEHARNLTRENAEDVIKNSIISIVQWKGQRVLYYSQNGATVIDKKTKEIITTWDSSDFDEDVQKIIKEILSSGKK